ncbi:MAG TPA: DNA recombination protein RmuC [Candidatus Dormibacteraeota bacterium]|nr:DNA recombination protein RmuC [Candidatus Dormibacteraeota bacterium]
MIPLLIGIVVLLALLALWQVWQSAQNQKKDTQLEAQMTELRRDLQTIATAHASGTGKLEAIAQNMEHRLAGVTQALQDGVKDSATISSQITSQSQTAMANELKSTREQIGLIQKQLGEVQEAGKQMSQATQTLESILGGAKSRGSFGEVTLERLLEDALPPGFFAIQHRFLSGEAADAVVFLLDKKLMAIDSKFPLDAFRRIGAEGEEARKSFATAVKGHAESIAKKYIVPQEGTLDLALMFVPSENVYYELLMTQDSKGQLLDAFCRDKKVIAVSPNTLYAHLCVINMGMRGMKIEENAKRLHASLAGLDKQIGTFTDIFEKLGGHLKNAQQSYNDADKRLEKAQTTLGNLLAAVPEDALIPPAPEIVPPTLPFEASSKAKA